MTRIYARIRLVAVIAALCAVIGWAAVATPAAQGASYAAQIQQALRGFVQQVHTWTATQTFSSIVVSGSCTGCGGGGTPGGSTTQVQRNNAGAFGGITGATSDGTTLTLVAPVLGTPASATLTNATGLPISTGVSGLGTGVAAFLGTPSSANLATALTDETGSGLAVFATSPTLTTPVLGAATFTSLSSTSTSTGINYTPNTSAGPLFFNANNSSATGGVAGVFQHASGGQLYVGVASSTGTWTGGLANNGYLMVNNSFPLHLGTNGTVRATVFANGNVGIGTTTDAADALVQIGGLQSSYGPIIRGTKFTTSGCSISATTGGATGGTYTSGTTGSCTVTITMGNSATAPVGWICSASDMTTPANLQAQSASSTTTCTITGTTVSGDVISWHAHGY